ncbi:hypothetical protein [Brevirhabdus sp.]|uniref:hypothetical protein n=1 Tax=Brevirhabdus sp. TaxID=2004514 RepID=UPI0040585427
MADSGLTQAGQDAAGDDTPETASSHARPPSPPLTGRAPLDDRLLGLLLIALTGIVIFSEWLGQRHYGLLAAGIVVVAVALMSLHVRAVRLIFVAVALALTGWAFVDRPDAWAQINAGLQRAAFIGGFFTALASLRHAAETSPAIMRCGRYLATQPPGRRFAALTAGGHGFGLLLNYGAIALLGSLAAANAAQEPRADVRAHRLRRMLLGIQCGFVSILPWSPLSFSMAITTSIIPGASWARAVPYALVSSVIVAALGWAMDTIFKPRIAGAPLKPPKPEGTIASLAPLALLLSILIVSVFSLSALAQVRIIAVVVAVVPAISLIWVAIQGRGTPAGVLGNMRRKSARFAVVNMPGYRTEMLVLMMAGYIGTLGSTVLSGHIADLGIDLSALPPLVILVGLVWVIPLSGQLGMNPILSVTLLAPLLPSAATMGVDPSVVVVAITSGWALSGASSPYTATTMLIGSFANVSATHVGVVWNRYYALVCGGVLSLWVALLALW